MNSYIVVHSGVLGMKWGVRRNKERRAARKAGRLSKK